MLEPRRDGGFESWETLKATLAPLLDYIGRYFLPWSKANADALAAGAKEFSVELPGGTYIQPPQKYHAKSLEAIRSKFRNLSTNTEVNAILRETECARYLT